MKTICRCQLRFWFCVALGSLPVYAQQRLVPRDINCSADEKISMVYGTATPGLIITTVGEQISGQVGTFLICHGNGVLNYGGQVNWLPNDFSVISVPDPFYLGRMNTSYAYSKSGRYNVTAKIGALCYYAQRTPHGVQEASCGSATAVVYEGIPPISLVLTCGGTTSCATVKGGTKLSGAVTLTSKSQDIGTLVRLAASANALMIPYVIVDKNLNVVTFDIQTSPVASAQTIGLSAVSGGFYVYANLALTP